MEQRKHAKSLARRGVAALFAWLALAVALPATAAAPAAEPLRLEAEQGQWPLGAHTRYLHDTDGRMTAAQAWRRLDAAGFEPLPDAGAAFGFQQGAYWFTCR